jgi:pyridinium-3,5-biscarboxylic acid mononucleotide synthase
MDSAKLRQLLEQVHSGDIDIESALSRLHLLPYEDLGFAKVDHHRALRHGMPEVVFAQGKTPDQVVAIARTLLETSPNVLITRTDRECAASVLKNLSGSEHFPLSGAIRFWRDRTVKG